MTEWEIDHVFEPQLAITTYNAQTMVWLEKVDITFNLLFIIL